MKEIFMMMEEAVSTERETAAESVAEENFTRWNDALRTLDPEAVAALYARDNSFLPTLSPDFKRGTDGAREYFVHFLEKHPVGTVVEEAVQPLGDDAYLHSGFYDFEVDDGKDGRAIAHARFTYLWVREEGAWKIAHHHSSLVPSV